MEKCEIWAIRVKTKTELAAKPAAEIKASQTVVTKAIAVVTDSIAQALRKGDKVTRIGFGTFSVSDRKARKRRTPRTGKEIKIVARKAPKFTAGAALKASVSGKAAPSNAKPKAKKAPAKPVAKA
jgi:DNA-binding protein HU-beta